MKSVSTLTSLAMLKVHQDASGADYFDYLVPFVTYVLEDSQGLKAYDLQKLLQQEFGIRLPQRVIDVVARRLVKRKLALEQKRTYALIPNAGFDRSTFDMKRSEVRRRLQVVINALKAYAATSGLQWDDTQATGALTGYLGRYTIDCLQTYSCGAPLPEIQSTATETYVVNSFIRSAHEHSTGLFADVILLVESQMLFNGLVCDDLGWTKKELGGVTFYLDTPLILPLFGIDGEEKKASVLELLDLVRNLKGRVAIFEHTAEEVDRVLERCEQTFDTGKARSPLVWELRRAGKSASDISLVRANVNETYERLGIHVDHTPRHLLEFQIDEAALEEAIRDEISYWNDGALRYDIKSIRSVFTIRRGKVAPRLEQCRAVLVTSNTALARVAHSYGREHESTRDVSSVITDLTLANIAWLKAPMGAPDLPRMEVLASCHAAMQPKAGLLERFIAEIGRLRIAGNITPQQHEHLRLSPRVRDELMRHTLGDERRVTRKTVLEIINSAEAAIVERERAVWHGQLRERDDEVSQLRADLRQVTRDATRARLSAEAQVAAQRKQLFWFADQVGQAVAVAALVILIALGAASAFGVATGATRTGGILTVLFVLGMFSWDQVGKVFGVSAVSVSTKLRDKVTSAVFRALLRVFLRVVPEDRPNETAEPSATRVGEPHDERATVLQKS